MKNIRRTSSQKQGERKQSEIEREPGMHFAQLGNSMNFTFQNGGERNSVQERMSFMENLEVEKIEDGETNQYKERASNYRTYEQMCKDLQFIQMLGNPRYVTTLFEMGYFYNQDFRDYIQGLKLFLKKPELIRLVKYPEGLYNLELMLKKGFMQALEIPESRDRFIVNSLKKNLEIKKSYRIWRNFDNPPTRTMD